MLRCGSSSSASCTGTQISSAVIYNDNWLANTRCIQDLQQMTDFGLIAYSSMARLQLFRMFESWVPYLMVVACLWTTNALADDDDAVDGNPNFAYLAFRGAEVAEARHVDSTHTHSTHSCTQWTAMRFIWKNLNKFICGWISARARGSANLITPCVSSYPEMKMNQRAKSHVWRSRLVSSESLNCTERICGMNANGIRAIYEFHMFLLTHALRCRLFLFRFVYYSTTHCVCIAGAHRMGCAEFESYRNDIVFEVEEIPNKRRYCAHTIGTRRNILHSAHTPQFYM